MADVPVKFILTVLRPDQRQYRQQEVELFSDQEVEVLVPLTNEMISNSEEVIQAKLGSGNVANPNPILTVAGLKYVIDQFDNIFLKPEEKAVQDTKDEDWGDALEDTKSAEKATTPASDDLEEWEEVKEETKDAPWDADNEEWN